MARFETITTATFKGIQKMDRRHLQGHPRHAVWAAAKRILAHHATSAIITDAANDADTVVNNIITSAFNAAGKENS